jgi:hypothetical protein
VGRGGTVVTGGVCEKVNTTGVASNARDAAVTTKQAQCMADIIVNAFTCDRTRICDFGMSFSGGHHEGLLGMARAGTTTSRTSARPPIRSPWRQPTSPRGRRSSSSIGSGPATSPTSPSGSSTIKEGSGTMLDNTLMVWGVESGTNHNHSPRDMQYLLIGGRNLGIKTGQYLKLASTQSSNKLLTSIMNAYGYAATGLGIEPTVGPLAGVL